MRYKIVSIIVWALLCTMHVSAAAEGISPDRLFYEQCSRLSSHDLEEKAYSYLSQRDKRDSAACCYTILAGRYRKGKSDAKDLKYVVTAMTNLAVMYMSYYFDYVKSYDYLIQASQIAREASMKKELSSICLAMANVIQLENEGLDDSNHKREVCSLLKESFYTAIESSCTENIAIALENLIDTSINNDSVDGIRDEIVCFEKLSLPMDSTMRRSISLLCQGAEAYMQGDFLLAGDRFQASASCTWDDLLIVRHQMSQLLKAGQMYQLGKDYDKAAATFGQVLGIALDEGNKDYIWAAYNNLGNLCGETGDTLGQQHYDYLKLLYKDSLMNQGRLASVESAKFLYELRATESEMKALAQRHRMQTHLLIAGLVVLAVICLQLYRLWQTYRVVRADRRYLYNYNVQLLQWQEEYRQQQEQQEQQEDSAKAGKYKNSWMDEDDEKDIYARIISVFEKNGEIFDTGFTIERLGELVHCHHRYVSQAINNVSGENFKTLLTRYRINEACRRLNDQQHYGHLTISAIAESVGFKSRTNFAALFKQTTGLTPSQYLAQARQQADEKSFYTK